MCVGVVYRCEAASLAGFIQQVAVSYVGSGYIFYVAGTVPERKDPRRVDEKIIDRYGIAISRSARARRKRGGYANVHYIRHRQFFTILATRGVHPFFESEPFLDIRRVPLRYGGYSVGYRKSTVTGRWHPSVRIEREEYLRLKSYFFEGATHRTRAELETELGRVPFEPFAPVRRQMLNIVRALNRVRRTAGLERVSWECLRLRRRPVRVFAEPGAGGEHQGVVGGTVHAEASAHG